MRLYPESVASYLEDDANLETVYAVFMFIWAGAFIAALFSGELFFILVSIWGFLRAYVDRFSVRKRLAKTTDEE